MTVIGGRVLRLTVFQQVSRMKDSRGEPLAVNVRTVSGGQMRATEALQHLPHLIANGIIVEILTPAGNKLDPSALIDKSPEQIDMVALQLDTVLGVSRLAQVSLADQIGVEIIRLEAGEFTYRRRQGVRFNGCGIAKTPFTNGQFEELLKLRRNELSEIVTDPDARLKKSMGVAVVAAVQKDCPMVYISQTEAAGIAKLLGLRLPTEVESERAASYTDGRGYPFGNDFDSNNVTFNVRGTNSVYAHPDGASPEGILDLAGNVWEWTSSDFSSGFVNTTAKVLRGGSWSSNDPGNLRVDYRGYLGNPEDSTDHVGFRLAKD